jgi:hypothetical protein
MTSRDICDASETKDDLALICPLPPIPKYESYHKDIFQYICLASPKKVIDRLRAAARENEEYRQLSPLPIISLNPTIDEEQPNLLVVADGLHTFVGTTFCLTYESSQYEISMVGFVTRGVFLIELGRMEQDRMIKKLPSLAKPLGYNKKGPHKEMFMRIESWDSLQRRKWRDDVEAGKWKKAVDPKAKPGLSKLHNS